MAAVLHEDEEPNPLALGALDHNPRRSSVSVILRTAVTVRASTEGRIARNGMHSCRSTMAMLPGLNGNLRPVIRAPRQRRMPNGRNPTQLG